MDAARLSIRELKAECARYGVSSDSCTEKSELVALVSRLHTGGAPPPPPSPASSSKAPAQRAAAPAEPSEKDGPGWEDVRRVLRCPATDYYAILGVTESADEKAVKKAYRLLALKLHPDKCRAARADEAFKRVGAAFATLSDPRKRMAFDAAGGAAGAAAAAAAAEGRGHGGMHGGFGGCGGMHGGFGDRDAEELFRAFFGSDGSAGPSWWGGECATPCFRRVVGRSTTAVAGERQRGRVVRR